MRASLIIPPPPDRLHAAGCTPDAIAMRERFVRGAADAWSRAGHQEAAERLSADAAALRDRFALAERRHERGGNPVRA